MSKTKAALIAGCSIGLLIGTKLFLYHEKNQKVPRQYSTKKVLSKQRRESQQKSIEKTLRNGFTRNKVPKDIDVIVIGSGIGGLTCAALLSMVGKRVLVLEQHYIAGGCTHAFEEKGIEFDTGIHYVGQFGADSTSTSKLICDLITNQQVKWDQTGTDESDQDEYKKCYDEIAIGEQHRYHLRAGKDEWLKEMKKHFKPEQVREAERFLNEEILTAKKPLDTFFDSKVIKYPWLQTLYLKLFSGEFFRRVNESAMDVIRKYTQNEQLQQMLLALFADISVDPVACPGLMYTNVLKHYLDGGYYPNGGCTQIAYHIINTIKRTGGDVLVRKRVKQILVDPHTKRVRGVQMQNGQNIYANTVVSACGFYNTYNHLLKEVQFPSKQATLDQINNKIGLTGCFVYVFVGLDGDSDELGLRSSNLWYFPHGDYGRLFQELFANSSSAPAPYFIAFPCKKDKSWKQRYPGKSNAIVLTACSYQEFEEWKGSKFGKRSKEYEAKKKMYCQRALNEGLFKFYPATKGKVLFTEVGSPLTFNHFIASNKGEVYGLDLAKQRFDEMDAWRADSLHQEINGLYLTGQDVTMLGFSAALMSGVLTAHNMLGYGGITDLLSGRNLITDIHHIKSQE